MTKCMKKEQKDLIIGTLLGDGNLKTETKGRTWSYRAIHKKEHKEYIEHKYNILKGMCKSEIKLSKIWDKRTKKEYEYYIFNTTVQNSLKFYGNLFYIYDSERKIVIKKVPLKIEKFLTPKAIAYWYMDDGSIKWLGKSNVMRICTENFSFECIQRLKKVLKKKIWYRCTIKKKVKKDNIIGYRIAINEKNSEKFRDLIKPYLINCMRYKVSDGNKGHL